MTYKLTGSPILKGEKNVTIVTIEKEETGRYSYERVELQAIARMIMKKC